MNPEAAAAPDEVQGRENAKRNQILEGARRVFLSSGFAAASMGEIARVAGVSKGTLYVYFDSKEALFGALIDETKRDTAERGVTLDPNADPRSGLTAFATALIGKLSAPQHVSMIRMVIGAAEAFPDLAQAFYRAGPQHGRRCLSDYLREQTAKGRLRVPDPDLAACQFLGMCTNRVTVEVVLAGLPAPGAADAARIAEAAVTTFLAAYGPEAPSATS